MLIAPRGPMKIRLGPTAQPPPPSMAHVAIARFYYRHVRVQAPRPTSIVEAIAAAPSPFAVEGFLDDFRRFGRGASPKTRAQVEETARVRLCELRGLLP